MDYLSYPYNPTIEKIVDVLVSRTQNYDREFFRLQANFYLSLIPSNMNIKIDSPVTGVIPINFYGINLNVSGSGKGFSTNVLEQEVTKEFRDHFTMEVFPKKAMLSLDIEAQRRASSSGLSHTEAFEALESEFKRMGAYRFTFDSATTPAVKQLRHKILLAKAGAINFILDEVGANLQANLDPLHTFLELYDKGRVKEKLIKSTVDNSRHQEIEGETPTNMLLFGTPSKLLNGGKIEDDFFDLLEMGFARRCFFAFSKKSTKLTELTPEELYNTIANQANTHDLYDISHKLLGLCNINLLNSVIKTDKDINIALLAYRRDCELRANELPEHAAIQKSELAHRYFKAFKLAGAYAYLDNSLHMKMEHLQQAIKFTEQSGEALEKILHREKPYERLAKYIATANTELTQVDLTENLPFYKGSSSQKNELIQLAIAWGYANNIIIKRGIKDNIEFFSGESLKETDLTKIKIAYSQHFSDGYINAEIDWNTGFDTLLPLENYHWINHHTSNGHRDSKSMIPSFNVVVLDVDDGIQLDMAKELLKEYEYVIHTTKRHQVPDDKGICKDRFRVILPMTHELALDEEDFKAFMKNIALWCPFKLDEQTFQRSRKWATTVGTTIYRNQGQLLDVLPFIPKTAREVEYQKAQTALGNLDGIERWFASRMTNGSRNNELIKYAFMLMDAGRTINEIQSTILSFNERLPDPLSETEILSTIMKSVSNRKLGG